MLLQCREAETDAELKAIGWLRAQSFYAYPPERAFAGEVSSRVFLTLTILDHQLA